MATKAKAKKPTPRCHQCQAEGITIPFGESEVYVCPNDNNYLGPVWVDDE